MDPILGTIILSGLTFTPAGWAACDGALLDIASNNALFALLGTTFGGDGTKTFALPKLKEPHAGVHYMIATAGIFPSRP